MAFSGLAVTRQPPPETRISESLKPSMGDLMFRKCLRGWNFLFVKFWAEAGLYWEIN